MIKEFNNYNEFTEYLNKLKELKGKKPFNCPYAVVLPEEAIYMGEIKYPKDSIACSERLDHKCQLHHQMHDEIINKKGELEARCGFNLSKFKLKIKSFKSSKDFGAGGGGSAG